MTVRNRVYTLAPVEEHLAIGSNIKHHEQYLHQYINAPIYFQQYILTINAPIYNVYNVANTPKPDQVDQIM